MAGSWDRNWQRSRGTTRSQFRLENLQSFRCTYPVYLTDIMDASFSSHSSPASPAGNIPNNEDLFAKAGVRRGCSCMSPSKDNRVRSVRNIEEEIEQLKKENFDLKLKVFLFEEEHRKKYHDKNDGSDDEMGCSLNVVVNLRVETELLRKELIDKDEALQSALEKLENSPGYREENAALNNALEQANKLVAELHKKEQDLKISNNKIEELSAELGKKELALQESQDLVTKKDLEIKTLKEDFEELKIALEKYPPTEEILDLVNQSKMLGTDNELLKNTLAQRDNEIEEIKKRLESLNSEKEKLNLKISNYRKTIDGLTKRYNEDIKMPTLIRPIVKDAVTAALSANKNEVLAGVKNFKSALYELMPKSSDKSFPNSQSSESLEESQEKGSSTERKSKRSQEKMLVTPSLVNSNNEVDIVPKENSAAQTDIQWQLIESKLSDKNMQAFGDSNDIEELKEEILMLLLAVEQKELSDLDQKLISNNAYDGNGVSLKESDSLGKVEEDFSTERAQLQKRLAISCSVNKQLLRHLQSLENFMEGLLNQKNLSTSSLDNVNETADFYSQVSKCLDESMKLSLVLSDQLSICEGSKIFEPCDMTVNRDEIYFNDLKSYDLDPESRFSQTESDILSITQEGMNPYYSSNKEYDKHSFRTSRRRLFSSSEHTFQSSERDNVVILKTGNNEDLILVLNSKGDPEDVLIRNSADKMAEEGDQHRRRCWDASMNNLAWNAERFSVANYKENIFNFEEGNSFKPANAKYNSWMSSDSDTWSEPDRNVSMQRIGIDIQTSPITSKSPKRYRLKDRRMTEDSTKNESASSYVKLHSWSKRRRCSDTSKSPFICKKCRRQFYQSADFTTDDLKYVNEGMQDPHKINSDHLKELENFRESLANKENYIETLKIEKQDLENHVKILKVELQELRRSNEEIKMKNNEFSSEVANGNQANNELKKLMESLEKKAAESNMVCEGLSLELKQTKERLIELQNKCSEYEENFASSNKSNEEQKIKIDTLEQKEKALLNEIKELNAQKDSLLDNLNVEKEHKLTLEKKLEEKESNIVELKSINSELTSAKNNISADKARIEDELASTNSLCETLKAEIETQLGTLETFKNKCDLYKAELESLTASEQVTVQSLLKFKQEFVDNLKMFKSVCSNLSLLKSEDLDAISTVLDMTDYQDEQIIQLLKDLNDNNSILKHIVENIEHALHIMDKTKHSNESALEEANAKVAILEQQIELKDNEITALKEKVNKIQYTIDEMKISAAEFGSLEEGQKFQLSEALRKLNDREEQVRSLIDENTQLNKNLYMLQDQLITIEMSAFQKAEALKQQIASLEIIIENDKALIDSNDKEISSLKGKIIQLQENVANLEDKNISGSKSPKSSGTTPSNLPDNSGAKVSSLDTIPFQDSKRHSGENTSDSTLPLKSHHSSAHNKDHEKCIRKIKSLQSKLEMTEKRIEMLEKEKENLRENLLSAVRQNKRRSSSEGLDSTADKLDELKTILETKQSFINDLKSDLYKAHDSLIDKQMEVDKLMKEFSEYKKMVEENSRTQCQNIPDKRSSDTILNITQSTINDLRKHKHNLVDSLLDLQKNFYNAKNIRLTHFEKFTNHIESLRLLQMQPSLHKSESAPSVNKPWSQGLEESRKLDKTLKDVKIDLEIDIECLQNFNRFLKRFFVPSMLQPSQSCEQLNEVQHKRNACVQTYDEEYSKLVVPVPDFESHERLRASPATPCDRLTATALSISQKLDWVESSLKNIFEEFNNITESDYSADETSRLTAAKHILLKLYEGLHLLQDNAEDVFYLNTALKSLELFASKDPKNTDKQDVSDRESLLSEETITLSRSESLSPVSFDGQSMQQSERQDTNHSYLVKQSEDSKREPIRSFHRLLSSSQDSVFQRSHYSSPDLGIESDPNHEHSAPERAENSHANKILNSRSELSTSDIQALLQKQRSSIYALSNSSLKIDDNLSFTIGDTLHAIGILQEYQLLKEEISECAIGIKSIIFRTGDGMELVSNQASPRKKVEFNTFKAIRDTALNIEVCLQKAQKIIENFWVAPCPSEEELKRFLHHNEELNAKLKRLYESKKKQEKDFKDVLERLKQAELIKEQQELKISKRLVKTKKVLRLAEKKLLETKNLEFPLLSRHTSTIRN